MYLDKLPTLKKKLLEATDFTEIVEYLFEELGNDPAFARSGKPTSNKRLLTTLAQVAASTVGTTGVFSGQAFRIASHRFVHGAFSLGREWTIMMFFFEDLDQGFMAIGDDSG